MPEQYEVFVSYSQDSPEHVAAVRTLSDRCARPIRALAAAGLATVDGQQDSVVPLCSHGLHRSLLQTRVMGTEAEGVGHGVRWEGNLIY